MSEPLHTKVERIVKRFGFDAVRVTSLNAGHVELSGTVREIDDRALLVAVVRTTPGVQEIRNEVTIIKVLNSI